jgi:hypothetical protein
MNAAIALAVLGCADRGVGRPVLRLARLHAGRLAGVYPAAKDRAEDVHPRGAPDHLGLGDDDGELTAPAAER